MKKRILSLFLASVMLLSMLGTTAFANGEEVPASEPSPEVTETIEPVTEAPAPGAEASSEPVEEPSVEVTPEPIVEPTAEPTPEPTAEPTVAPVEETPVNEAPPVEVVEPVSEPASVASSPVAEVGGQQYDTLEQAIKNAGGQEIRIMQDTTISTSSSGPAWGLVLSGTVNINLDSRTLIVSNAQSNPAYIGVFCYPGSTVALRNGTIKMEDSSPNSSVIAAIGAHVSLTDVTVQSNQIGLFLQNQGVAQPGSLTLSGGSVTASRPVQHNGAFNSSEAGTNSLSLDNGAVLTANDSYAAVTDTDNHGSSLNVTVTNGTIDGGNSAGILMMSNGQINVNGGTVTGSTGIIMTNGTLNVAGGTVSATGSYNAAGGDRPDKGVDEDGSAVMIISGGSGAIGGGNVTLNITQGSVTSANGYAVNEMTAKSSTGGNGTMSAIVSGGTLTGGTSVGNAAIHTTNVENTNVTGGKFSSNVSEYVDTEAVAQVGSGANSFIVGQAAIIEAASQLPEGSITVYQGDVELTGLQNGVTVQNEGTGSVSANGESVEQGSDVTVGEEPVEKTLQQLITDAQDGETVQLDKSYNENIVIPDGKTITIDLNGQTITGSAADTIVIGKGATVIIKDSQPGNYGTVTNTGNFRAITNKGTLTLDGGTYTRADGTNNYVIFNDGCSEAGVVGNLTLQRGIVKSNSATSSCICNDEGIITTSSYITVEAAYNPIKNNACAQVGKGKITISGATITCTNPENSFAIQNNGELVIEFGSITGDVVTLSGDGIEGDDSYVGKTTIQGGHITGDVSCGPMESGVKPENAPTVSITGGTVTGEVYAVTSKDGSKVERDDQETNIKFSVSGGTFSTQVKEEFVAEGVAEAKIKDIYYVGSAIDSHIGSLTDGDTIEVLTGDLTIDGVATGVIVKNSGKGTVTVDGQDVPADGGSVTTQERVELAIEMKTSYDAPKDNPILPKDDFVFGLLSGLCAFPGGTVNYSFDVYIPSGHSSSEAKNVVVTDKLPDGFTAKSVSQDNDNVTHQYDAASNTMTWTIKSIKGTGKTNKVTVAVGLGIPEEPVQAGWENYATATLDNGVSESYRSAVADKFADDQQENQFYSYFLGLDANGGTDNADGLPYFFFQLKHQFDTEVITAAPEVTLPFPGDWYYGYAVDADSYGGDPTPGDLGNNVLFAGWSESQHVGVQSSKPSDMVAVVKDGSIVGSYTFKGITKLYAVWAPDDDSNDVIDWYEVSAEDAYVTFSAGDGEGDDTFLAEADVNDGMIILPGIGTVPEDQVGNPYVDFQAPKGFVFDCWERESTGETFAEFEPCMDVQKGDKFTAKWVQGVTLTYDYNGSAAADQENDKSVFTYRKGDIVALAEPNGLYVIPNKAFGGWQINDGDIMEPGEELTIMNDTVAKAQWVDPADIAVTMTVDYEAPADMPHTTASDAAADGHVFPGGTITYTYNITASLPSEGKSEATAAQNVVVKDVLPADFFPVDYDPSSDLEPADSSEYTYDPETHTVTWHIESLDIGSTETVSVTLKVPVEPSASSWTNYATATIDNSPEFDTEYRSQPDDTDAVKNSESKTYSFWTFFDANGSTAKHSGEAMDYVFTKLGSVSMLPGNKPSYAMDFSASWYDDEVGTPDAPEKTVFAGWSPVKHEGAQAEKPDDMVAEWNAAVNELIGTYTKVGNDVFYAVWAADEDGNGVADWDDTKEPEPTPVPGKADLRQLRIAIGAANSIDQFLVSNWDEVMTEALQTAQALSDREAELTDADQAEVDAAALALTEAIGKLVYKPAEITELTVWIAEAEALNPKDYEDFSAVQTALQEARAAMSSHRDIRDQERIDAAVQALSDAIAALEKKGSDDPTPTPGGDGPGEPEEGMADMRMLFAAITAAEAIDSKNVSNWDEVMAGPLKTAKDLMARADELTEDQQETVDAAAQAVRDAMAQLTYKKADLTILKAAILKATMLNPDEYEDFSQVTAALTAANALVEEEPDIRSQEQVDEAAANLESAMQLLVKKGEDKPGVSADYSKVEAAKAKAAALNSESYTTESWTALQNAIKAVVYGKSVEEQAEVDAMAKAIEDALTKLVYKTVDVTSLRNAIAKAESLTANNYKDFSGVTQALALAKQILGYEHPTQADVQKALTSLVNAINALQYKAADLTALQAAVNKAQALNRNQYADLVALDAALAKAYALLQAKPDIRSQSEVTLAAQTLEQAIVNLKLKTDVTPSPDPNGGSGDNATNSDPGKEDTTTYGKTAPTTGDETNVTLYVVLLAVCLVLAGCVGFMIYKRRKANK